MVCTRNCILNLAILQGWMRYCGNVVLRLWAGHDASGRRQDAIQHHGWRSTVDSFYRRRSGHTGERRESCQPRCTPQSFASFAGWLVRPGQSAGQWPNQKGLNTRGVLAPCHWQCWSIHRCCQSCPRPHNDLRPRGNCRIHARCPNTLIWSKFRAARHDHTWPWRPGTPCRAGS